MSTTSEHIEPLIEESVDIAASPAQVWALVSDLPRLAEWSPQVVKSWVKGGAKEGLIRLGTNLVNLNRRGPLFWPTRTRVVKFDPHHEIKFRILDNLSVWSFELTPTAEGGTHLVHRRETPDGLTPISVFLTKRAFGGQANFTGELRQGMCQTLDRVKRDAEQGEV